MYAQLCHRLCEEAPNFESKDSREPCTFRLLLLGSCRQKFESRPKNERDKRKSLGNIKFIGELCKLGVVSESILHKCMLLLLKKCDVDEQAENLECLCQILKTCGHLLDHPKGQKLMNQYFERMESLMENEALPSRIRFMLQDSIELRGNAWVPRKAAKIEGPLPMNQIMVDGDGGTGVRERPPQQELFPRQLKIRTSTIDVMLSNGTIHFPQSDKFPPLYSSPNGYAPGGRGPSLKVSPLLYSQPTSLNIPYHHNNRYNNNSNNNNTKNNNIKDMTPRFKRINPETTNLEEVSLRPPANSMLVKQFNTKPAGQTIGNPLFKNSTGPVLSEHKPVVIQSSKEVPIVIKPCNTDKAKPSKKDKATSKEEMMRKINGIAEEVLKEGGSLVEAVNSFSQLKIQDRLVAECIVSLLSTTFHKTDNDRKTMMNLVVELKNESSVAGCQVSEAFRCVIKAMPDTRSTIPDIMEVVSGLAAEGVALELLTLDQLGELTENGCHFPFMFLTLRRLHHLVGKQRLSKLFSDSKVSLMWCLLEGERRKEKLEEVLGESLLYLCPVLELEGQLWQALDREPSAHSLYRQAKESLGPTDAPTHPFITALVTVVIKYICQESVKESDKVAQDKEKALLERFKGVLQAFLHENLSLQVTAVYALQMFAYYLDFPKGMLLRWFLYLYNLEIVEEEAFLKWREDDVTDAYPGKGEALFQVNQWLNWLSTAEEEEEEEDDGEN